jgi:hypothetical protein
MRDGGGEWVSGWQSGHHPGHNSGRITMQMSNHLDNAGLRPGIGLPSTAYRVSTPLLSATPHYTCITFRFFTLTHVIYSTHSFLCTTFAQLIHSTLEINLTLFFTPRPPTQPLRGPIELIQLLCCMTLTLLHWSTVTLLTLFLYFLIITSYGELW